MTLLAAASWLFRRPRSQPAARRRSRCSASPSASPWSSRWSRLARAHACRSSSTCRPRARMIHGHRRQLLAQATRIRARATSRSRAIWAGGAARAGRARRERASRRTKGWSGWASRPGCPDAARRRRSPPTTSGPSPATSTAFATRPPASATGRRRIAARHGFFGRLHGTDVDYPEMRALHARRRAASSARGRQRSRETVARAVGPAPRQAVFGTAPALRPDHRDTRVTRYSRGRRRRRPAGLAWPRTTLDGAYLPYTTVQDLLVITHLHTAAGVGRRGRRVDARSRATSPACFATRHQPGARRAGRFHRRTQARDAMIGKGVNPMLARAVAGSVVNLDDVTLTRWRVSLERSSRTMTALLASVASGLAAGRRHRHHEHHARLGDRAHARDRAADGASARAAATC